MVIAGNHSINVLNDGTSVHGMPLVSKVYNTSAIAVTPVNAGIVGLPVEFSSKNSICFDFSYIRF